MTGPCLCGDIYCGSCGPAQGNVKCFVCGAWTVDGGCVDPEACAKAEEAFEDQMDRIHAEMEQFADEWRDF